MCYQNSGNPAPTLYCRTCQRIVTADEAALICFATHDVDTSQDDLFGEAS